MSCDGGHLGFPIHIKSQLCSRTVQIQSCWQFIRKGYYLFSYSVLWLYSKNEIMWWWPSWNSDRIKMHLFKAPSNYHSCTFWVQFAMTAIQVFFLNMYTHTKKQLKTGIGSSTKFLEYPYQIFHVVSKREIFEFQPIRTKFPGSHVKFRIKWVRKRRLESEKLTDLKAHFLQIRSNLICYILSQKIKQ